VYIKAFVLSTAGMAVQYSTVQRILNSTVCNLVLKAAAVAPPNVSEKKLIDALFHTDAELRQAQVTWFATFNYVLAFHYSRTLVYVFSEYSLLMLLNTALLVDSVIVLLSVPR